MKIPQTFDDAGIFVGDGEMARLMRAYDWQATSLGAPARWPEALKAATRLLLSSRFEMWLGWGPEIAFLYNDAYRPTLGLKHPRALGEPMQELWSEVWEDVKGRVSTVLDHGQATWDRALLLLLERSGYAEETYHTFSYSPLRGDDGRVEGLFCTVSEETERVLSERRLATLSGLASSLAGADSPEAVLAAASRVLGLATRDLPFSLIYRFEPSGGARRVGLSGIDADHRLALRFLAAGAECPWPAARMAEGAAEAVIALGDEFHDLPTGAWKVPPTTAVLLPIASQGASGPAGFLVVGLNPHRKFDVDCLGFVRLIAGQIASSLASAAVYDTERRRAVELDEAVRLRHEAAKVLRSANERLAAEVQARTAERDRLRELFVRAPGFMCVLRGHDQVFEFVNEAYLQLIGHRNPLGRSVREALPEIEGQFVLELLDQVQRTAVPFVGRAVSVMLKRAPNAPLEERFLNFVYQPIAASEAGPAGIFVEGNDVTEQVRAERALIGLNETLEARIVERTQELAVMVDRLQRESREREAVQEALRQAQKMEAVGQLTGGIAHDFNNLLQAITGSLELVRRRLGQGRYLEVDRYIVDASEAARRAAALTHRLLAFSRRQPLDPKPLEVNPLVASIEDLLRRTLGERVSLDTALAAPLWVTLCDANQLENALLNLCINARDAMPDGGRLTVSTANVEVDAAEARMADVRPGPFICVSVSDTGSGMSPDVLERAFDPFFTTKPTGQGTGLGLSMIYGFARQSDGHVQIQSQVGVGTTVRLYLPRYFGLPLQAEDEADPPGPHFATEGETVLVIEDESIVRGLVIEVLHELGYRAIEAADGPAGLAVLMSSQRIDLLVTDIGLPGLNGRQVADAARVSRPHLKVLFMTGYAETAVPANGFLEPGMQMLTKPFAVETLSRRLQELMNGPERRAN